MPFSPYATPSADNGTILRSSATSSPSSTGGGKINAPLVTPSKAMFHSLALPGWGQLNNGKRAKAALVVIAEAVCIGGFLYQNHLVKTETGSDWYMAALRSDRNSFVIYWLGTKLFGMIDAYVDAHLADYDVSDIAPKELTEEYD